MTAIDTNNHDMVFNLEPLPVRRPLVSIVLTTYNRCQLLARAVNSVLENTYQNFELIIVDDASSDKTLEIVSEFNDSRVQYLRMPENGGVLRARNRGFNMANGDYITILDDDDELVHDALQTVIAEFESVTDDDIEIIWFNCIDMETGQISGSMRAPKDVIKFNDYLCGCIQGDFWITFREKALRGNRFNEQLRAHESLLWMRIHRTHKALFNPKVLCKKYRKHGGDRLSDLRIRLNQLSESTLAMKLFIDEFGDELAITCPSQYGKRLAYLGLYQMAMGDFVLGRASMLSSFKYKLSVKYLLIYLLSFFLTANQIVALIEWKEA